MKRSFSFFFVCFVLFVTSSASGNSGASRCVPLKRCESIQWLINNLSRLPSDRRSTVVSRINQLQCGLNEMSEMMVMCPRTISDNLLGGEQDQRVVFGSRSAISSCIGSVKIFDLDVNRRSLLSVHSLSRTRYRDLTQILTPESVFRVRVDGNCCWKLYPRRDFRGEGFKLETAFDGLPISMASYQSLAKTACGPE